MDPKERTVNASEAGQLVHVHERTIRMRIASGALPASRTADGHTLAIRVSDLARVRGWKVDAERLALLHAPEPMPAPAAVPDASLEARVAALERQVAALVLARTSTIRSDPEPLPDRARPALAAPAPLALPVVLDDDPEGDPEPLPDGDVFTRPVVRRAPVLTGPITRTMRQRGQNKTYAMVPDDELLDAVLADVRHDPYLQADIRQAREGRLRMKLWGYLCRVDPWTVDGHAKAETNNKLRIDVRGKLKLYRIDEKSPRYMDAQMRAAWLQYWLEVSPVKGVPNAKRVPPPGEAERALETLVRWGAAVMPR